MFRNIKRNLQREDNRLSCLIESISRKENQKPINITSLKRIQGDDNLLPSLLSFSKNFSAGSLSKNPISSGERGTTYSQFSDISRLSKYSLLVSNRKTANSNQRPKISEFMSDSSRDKGVVERKSHQVSSAFQKNSTGVLKEKEVKSAKKVSTLDIDVEEEPLDLNFDNICQNLDQVKIGGGIEEEPVLKSQVLIGGRKQAKLKKNFVKKVRQLGNLLTNDGGRGKKETAKLTSLQKIEKLKSKLYSVDDKKIPVKAKITKNKPKRRKMKNLNQYKLSLKDTIKNFKTEKTSLKKPETHMVSKDKDPQEPPNHHTDEWSEDISILDSEFEGIKNTILRNFNSKIKREKYCPRKSDFLFEIEEEKF